MHIATAAADERSLVAKAYLDALEKTEEREGNMIILPIPSTRDGEHLCNSNIRLTVIASELSSGDIAVGYGLPEDFLCACYARGAVAVDISRDEEYLAEGAYLTAVGCIGYVLNNYTRAPRDLRIGVVGLGRIGGYLVGMLRALGASVIAFSSKCVGGSGVEVRPYSSLGNGDLSRLDMLINTAPARLIPESVCSGGSGIRIIELASGDNLPPLADPVRLPSLPARAFPKSAGLAYARAIERAIFPSVLS